MHTYLIDTEFATKSLIETIYAEEKAFEQMSERYAMLKAQFDHLQWDFSTADGSEDFDDLQVQAKFNRMAKFHQDAAFQTKKLELENLQQSIANKKFSVEALAMNLLQIAKQGMSTVHGPLQNCPDGRFIGSQTLKNVIWQARNQAIHCEEGNPNNAVRICFSTLTVDFGPDFDITSNPTDSKAKKVIDQLGWNSFHQYESDMQSLLG